ncbi:hypothetical protein ES707_18700 [subsurface metagenome]
MMSATRSSSQISFACSTIEQIPAWEHPVTTTSPNTVGGVDVAARRCLLKLKPPLDLAEEDQILGQPEGGRGEEDLPVPEEFLDREVAPDLSRTVKAPGEECVGMRDERGLDPRAALEDSLGMEPEQRVETPGVVEMAVGEDDLFDTEEVDPHLPGVGNEDARVAGIEEDTRPAVLEVDREPGFREEVAVGEGGVIHEDRQPHAQRLPGESRVRETAGVAVVPGVAAREDLRNAAPAVNGSMQIPGTSRLRRFPGGEPLRPLPEQ